jgi:hypothetical protein
MSCSIARRNNVASARKAEIAHGRFSQLRDAAGGQA